MCFFLLAPLPRVRQRAAASFSTSTHSVPRFCSQHPRKRRLPRPRLRAPQRAPRRRPHLATTCSTTLPTSLPVSLQMRHWPSHQTCGTRQAFPSPRPTRAAAQAHISSRSSSLRCLESLYPQRPYGCSSSLSTLTLAVPRMRSARRSSFRACPSLLPPATSRSLSLRRRGRGASTLRAPGSAMHSCSRRALH